jgi:hypothetical protein
MASIILVTDAVEVLEHPGKHIAREPDIANFVLRIQDRLGDQVRFDRKSTCPMRSTTYASDRDANAAATRRNQE